MQKTAAAVQRCTSLALNAIDSGGPVGAAANRRPDCPPGTTDALSVPIWAPHTLSPYRFRRWLSTRLRIARTKFR
eukprot:1096561-Rhodomonas_salina.2